MKNTFDILAANVVHCRVGHAKFYIHTIDTRVILRLENGTHWRRQYSTGAFLSRQHRPVIHTVDSRYCVYGVFLSTFARAGQLPMRGQRDQLQVSKARTSGGGAKTSFDIKHPEILTPMYSCLGMIEHTNF